MHRTSEPLAIVGMACRFPGGVDTAAEFWRLLAEGIDAIGPIPSDRWNASAIFHQDFTTRGRLHVLEGGFIEGVDKFDAAFFGIPPVEAKRMDPQQRILLECAFRAIEDSATPLDSLAGGSTGVFVGISTHDYGDIQQSPEERVNIGPHTNTGTATSIAANRISYAFDLHGPSVAVDTACSSSLTALHLACESIRSGECSQALVGGVNVILKPEPHIGFSKGGFLSPDARCMAFDARANGYVRSEGAGVVMLKPLAQALADRDRVYCTILATAINQDGRTIGLPAPNLGAQIALLRKTCERAGVNPAEVGYVQAHGTGTSAGDRTEALALGEVLGAGRSHKQPLLIGSVKTNIGHLEAASGIAGLIATALTLTHRKIPGNIHFRQAPADIPFAKLNIEVPRALCEWPEGNAVAGLNSFGFGGSNAHAVLAGHPETTALPGKDRLATFPFLLTLSASRKGDIAAIAGNYAQWIENRQPDLGRLCFTANQRRTHYKYRLAFPARSHAGICDGLEELAQGADLTVPGSSAAQGRPVFVFSGQGAQWWGMARELLEREPVFRRAICEIDDLFLPLAGFSILAEIEKEKNETRIDDTTVAQPAIFAVQVGLTKIWELLGVRPSAVVGHSVGEVAAAFSSGALSLPQAVRVIHQRSHIQSKASGAGKMLAIGISHAQAIEFLRGREDVCVAAVNGPNSVTTAGPVDAINLLARDCARAGMFHRLLEVDVPFHSALLDPLVPRLHEALSSLAPSAQTLPMYSSVKPGKIDGNALTADYWCDNMREPVLFAAAVQSMIEDGYNTFVEIGPHPILSAGISELANSLNAPVVVLASLRRDESDVDTMTSSLARLYETGTRIDWDARYEECPDFLDLPPYPLRRERFWQETPAALGKRMSQTVHPLMTGRTDLLHERGSVWHVDLDSRVHPFIRDHRVQGPIVFPGTGQIELAITAGKSIWKRLPGVIRNIELRSPVFLPDEGDPPAVQLEIISEDGNYALSSRAQGDTGAWTTHSTGRIVPGVEVEERAALDIEALKRRLTNSLDPDVVYDELWAGGLQLGATFRAARRIWSLDTEALVEIEIPESVSVDWNRYQIHPVVLDAALQMTVAAAYEHKSERELYLPTNVQRVVYYRKPTGAVYAHVQITHHDPAIIKSDIYLVGSDGEPVVTLEGIRYRYIAGTRDEFAGLSDRCLYEFAWSNTPRPGDNWAVSCAGALPDPTVLCQSLEPLCEEIRLRPLAGLYHRQFEPELDRLCDEYIIEALRSLGVLLQPGAPITTLGILSSAGIEERREPLLANLLRILVAHGRLDETENGQFVVTGRSTSLADASTLCSGLQERFPEFEAELQLIGRSGPALAEVLTGQVDPLGVLFPQDDWQSVADYYRAAYSFAPYNELLACAFAEIVAAMPADGTLRILEIGAGTGGMTQAILPLLPAERIEYTFSDLSPGFLAAARDRFAAYPFVNYLAFDLERAPEPQGLHPGGYDIIIASDVLHASSDVNEALGRIGSLLAPDGLLAILEVTRAPAYIELTFGLTDGWWAFRDHALRRFSPIMTQARWNEVLGGAHFSEVASISDALDEQQSAQTVFFARTDATQAAEPETPRQTAGDRWLIFPDGHGVAESLAGLLEGAGAQVVNLLPGASMVDALEEKGASESHLAGVIFARGLEPDAPADGVEAMNKQCRLGAELVEVYRQLVAGKTQPRLWILTAGAVAVDPADEVGNPFQAALWGLGRVAMNECPDVETILLDLPAQSPGGLAADVYSELCSGASGEERALRESGRYVHALSRLVPEEMERGAERDIVARGGSFRLQAAAGAGIENLHLTEVASIRPAAGEVLIDIHAIGLNFKDVMNATGLLSDEAVAGGRAGKSLGLECSGVIRELGAGVTGMAPGDRVMALASDCLGGQVSVDARHVLPIPSLFSMEEAAGVPVVYMTAYYTLQVLCRLVPGERILIHSGAGGVGLAAIQIAMAVGAEVLASVGSEDKEVFLRSMGVKTVINSRQAGFSDEIRALTNGRGVDVILNSLATDAIPEGIRCLAPFGRFVEIGKSDIYRDRQIGLKPFGENLSYFAVDIDRLLAQKPVLAASLFREVRGFIEQHGIRPHPTRSFPVDQAVAALRQLAQGKHIGKFVLSVPETDIAVRPAQRISLSSSGAYLVTGGTGGFGLAVAEWLAGIGAGLIVLLSRSGRVRVEERSALDRLISSSCRVEILRGDVADPSVVEDVLGKIDHTGFELRGVFHCAMVLDDAPLLDLDAWRFANALGPKAAGAWNLHLACCGKTLDYFVLFSSMAAVYGNAGQANYAAGNAILDSLAWYRRGRGEAALAINWGAIGGSGFVARNQKVRRILASQGWLQLPVKGALELLSLCLRQRATNRVALLADWAAVGKFFPLVAASPRFSHLVNEASSSHGASARADELSLPDTLRQASAGEGQARLTEVLAGFVARVLGLTPGSLDETESLQDLGFDSLMATQLSSWVRSQLNLEFSMMNIMRAPSLQSLAADLLNEVAHGPGGERGVSGDRQRRLVRINEAADGPRIICFPYLGGDAVSFEHWTEGAFSRIELYAVQPPGRGGAGATTSLDQLIDEITHEVEQLQGRPVALYGHSFGAWLAAAVAGNLIARGILQPAHLFVAAAPGPGTGHPLLTALDTFRQEHTPDDVPEAILFGQLRKLGMHSGGMHSDLAGAIRADLRLALHFDAGTVPKLALPVTAIWGRGDVSCPAEVVGTWANYCNGSFRNVAVDGGHLFLEESANSVIGVIESHLAASEVELAGHA